MTGEARFYIHRPDGGREGPYGLLDIIRKTRTGGLLADTPVSPESGGPIRKAAEFEELASFFQAGAAPQAKPDGGGQVVRALAGGWRFVGQQPVVCAFAGLGALLAYVPGLVLLMLLPWWYALWLWLALFLTAQSVLMMVVLRLYRGQYLDVPFVRSLGRTLPQLLIYALLAGAAALAGLAVGGLPGICLLALLAFVPYALSDRHLSLAGAVRTSLKTSFRGGAEGFGVLVVLTFLNLLGAVLIIVLPVTWPLLAAALVELYDEWAY